MDSRFNSPAEIASLVSKSGVTKSMLSLPKMILLGLMAGAFIAFGGAASNVAMHGVADVGLARVVAGVIFPVGLMLVVFTGSELFTGNCLMIIPTLEKKIKPVLMIKNLVTVYISNFVGAMIIDLLIFFSGQLNYSNGGLGAFTIKVALAKTTINPATAIVSGILCNILVCLAIVMATGATDEEKDSVYKNYYDYKEPVKKIAGHRVLAVNRGEKEGFLKVSVETDSEKPLNSIFRAMITDKNQLCSDIIREACTDAYQRLIYPSIEREVRNDLTDTASENAMKVFAVNLKQLLMQPPVKGKTVLALDPGYRTGCKTAVVDSTGKVLDTTVIYPTHSDKKIQESKQTLLRLIKKHHVDIISIGNGTASKETEMFTAETIKEADHPVYYMVVSEAGASVYSASKLAATELPDLDLTLRSAVSIARRLQDPLAELVKIEPKAIGVGQYQHDMPQKKLGETLDGVVEDCVNSVGADLNTASPALLSRVSGLNATVCKNIVAYREENGAFSSRAELKKVPKLGPKAFEQCAGFLRVPESRNPLDNTGVHPESYKSAKELLGLLEYSDKEIKSGNFSDIQQRVKAKGTKSLADVLGIGLPTLDDIVKELSKPGRDPRDELPAPMLRSDILDIKDLKEGMELKGTVRNVIDFGAFVDIGVHQDGLVHISQICDKYIKHPSEVLKVGDVVNVKVLSVDPEKNRISLTMKF